MKNVFKLAAVLAIILFIFLFFEFQLGQYLTLDYAKSQLSEFQTLYADHPIRVAAYYFLIYIAIAALSLPGAAVLTLIGGGLFGFYQGLILVSFASSIGATVAFLTSRFLLQNWVQKKMSKHLSAVNEGFAKDGVFYLLSLRLIPAVPFFVVNFVMGILPISTWTYYWVSQIGMLAGTAVYVNAGTALVEIKSLSDVLSAKVLISLALLGALPLLFKTMLNYLKSHRMLRRFKKPKSFDYNLVVIGGGSAGLVTSYISAAAQSRVALIEKHKMGGDCLNTGCVPSKTLIRTAKFMADVRNASQLGVAQASAEIDFAQVMERVTRVIKKIEPHDSIERYTSLGVQCFQGDAKIISPYEVQVNGQILTSKSIVIATGASAFVPQIKGLPEMQYLTSENIWQLRERPGKLLVLGGGPIGCELAQAFQRLGSRVSLVEKNPRILIREDAEISKLVAEKMQEDGVELLTGYEAIEFNQLNGKKICKIRAENQVLEIEFDQVLVALGRKPNVTGFGLEELGVETNKQGFIRVNELMQTNFPNIYACGDVAGPYQFTHTAAHQAWYCAVNSMLRPFYSFNVDHRIIPWATYTSPEVARVGLNELQAKESGIEYEVTTYDMKGQDRAITEEAAYGVVKVLTAPKSDRILGVTIVGLHAGDILAEYVLAMKYNLGLNKILGTIHVYPTLAEANKAVAGVWRRNHVSERALNFARIFNRWQRKTIL